MSQPYVGEVRLVGFNFAPAGWALCAGQTISIAEYSTLFNLIGTTYGGDGQSNFNLPNLQGRIPVHQGTNGATYVIGQTGGVEAVTLGIAQYPAHSHALLASPATTGGTNSAANNTVASTLKAYASGTPVTGINPVMVGSSGGNQPHDNLQPFLVLNWVISLYGVYPSQN
jgi:microcystin-dependent protein